MRVLLDECLPRKLKLDLAGHEVRTAQEEGWAGLKNGALLKAAAGPHRRVRATGGRSRGVVPRRAPDVIPNSAGRSSASGRLKPS